MPPAVEIARSGPATPEIASDALFTRCASVAEVGRQGAALALAKHREGGRRQRSLFRKRVRARNLFRGLAKAAARPVPAGVGREIDDETRRLAAIERVADRAGQSIDRAAFEPVARDDASPRTRLSPKVKAARFSGAPPSLSRVVSDHATTTPQLAGRSGATSTPASRRIAAHAAVGPEFGHEAPPIASSVASPVSVRRCAVTIFDDGAPVREADKRFSCNKRHAAIAQAQRAMRAGTATP